MRYYVLALAAASLLAQGTRRQYNTYTFDANGRRVAAASSSTISSASGSFRAETMQTINGRTVAIEQVEEKVVSEDSQGRVIERTIRRYDQNGRAASLEKVQIQERTDAAGGTTTLTTVYDSDINGRFMLHERSTARSAKTGEVVSSQTLVERPTLNGSFDLVEKRQAVQTGDEKNMQTDVSVFRRDTNGVLNQVERETTEVSVSEGLTTQTSATYNVNATGSMLLAGRRVSRVQKNRDGSEVEVVNLFGGNPPGRPANGFHPGPRLREQQVIERRPGPAGSIVETFSIRRADLESGRLGPAQKVSETVCSGKCVADPPAPPSPGAQSPQQ